MAFGQKIPIQCWLGIQTLFHKRSSLPDVTSLNLGSGVIVRMQDVRHRVHVV